MATDVKVQVLSAVVKQQELPYRASAVYHETGLPRQLVAYHLDRLLDTGYVEKHGVHYLNTNLNGLIESLAVAGSGERKQKVWSTKFLNRPEPVNSLIREILWAKSLGIVDADEMKMAVIAEIDDTIRSFKTARKMLVSEPPAAGAARKAIRKKNFDELLADIVENWRMFLGSAKEHRIEQALTKIWDETDE